MAWVLGFVLTFLGLMEVARRSHVQNLRTLAASYAVARVTDKASRERVTEMAMAIQNAPALTPEDSKALRQHWEGYKATNVKLGETADQDVAKGDSGQKTD